MLKAFEGVDDENDGAHKKEQNPHDSDEENSPETIFGCGTARRIGRCLPSGHILRGSISGWNYCFPSLWNVRRERFELVSAVSSG